MIGRKSAAATCFGLGQALVLLVFLGVAGGANAGLTTCSVTTDGTDANSTPDGLHTSDVTFNSIESTDCYGVIEGTNGGNAGASYANDAWSSLYGGGDFSEVLKTDTSLFDISDAESRGSFGDLDFGITAQTGATEGIFILAWKCNGGCPSVLDVAFGTKASNGSALYFFDDLVFDEAAYDYGVGLGHFEIAFTNGGGKTPELSNLVMLARQGTAVSEPGTLALLGVGLLALGLSGRKAAA